jgi:hypothetical protein
VAGFRHYEGMKQLHEMKEGDLLELVREPGNEHDDCAIALQWRGKKTGYIPSSTNEMLSYLVDADALSLFAVITHLEKNAQPWENVAVAVYFIQEANDQLPAHASYLTLIEAPHYRTLHKRDKKKAVKQPDYDDLFENTDRVINLDAIPGYHEEAKNYFEKCYGNYPVSIEGGRYAHVKNDGIYSYMYEIDDEIKLVKDVDGKEYLEFMLA